MESWGSGAPWPSWISGVAAVISSLRQASNVRSNCNGPRLRGCAIGELLMRASSEEGDSAWVVRDMSKTRPDGAQRGHGLRSLASDAGLQEE